MAQASPGKLDHLRRTPAGSTALAFDGTGLCDSLPARPAKDASYPVSVRQVAALLHTSFRRHLAMTPLCFASPSPPSGWTGDFHSPAIEHAGHTRGTARGGYKGFWLLPRSSEGPAGLVSWQAPGLVGRALLRQIDSGGVNGLVPEERI